MTKFLQEGDVIELEIGMEIYADVKEKQVYVNRKDSNKITHHNWRIDKKLAGKYVVYKTSHDGGASNVGMNGHDSYPDGHHVFCEKIDNPKIKVDFYQSGFFNAMIEPDKIQAIGKMTRVWKEK